MNIDRISGPIELPARKMGCLGSKNNYRSDRRASEVFSARAFFRSKPYYAVPVTPAQVIFLQQ